MRLVICKGQWYIVNDNKDLVEDGWIGLSKEQANSIIKHGGNTVIIWGMSIGTYITLEELELIERNNEVALYSHEVIVVNDEVRGKLVELRIRALYHGMILDKGILQKIVKYAIALMKDLPSVEVQAINGGTTISKIVHDGNCGYVIIVNQDIDIHGDEEHDVIIDSTDNGWIVASDKHAYVFTEPVIDEDAEIDLDEIYRTCKHRKCRVRIVQDIKERYPKWESGIKYIALTGVPIELIKGTKISVIDSKGNILHEINAKDRSITIDKEMIDSIEKEIEHNRIAIIPSKHGYVVRNRNCALIDNEVEISDSEALELMKRKNTELIIDGKYNEDKVFDARIIKEAYERILIAPYKLLLCIVNLDIKDELGNEVVVCIHINEDRVFNEGYWIDRTIIDKVLKALKEHKSSVMVCGIHEFNDRLTCMIHKMDRPWNM